MGYTQEDYERDLSRVLDEMDCPFTRKNGEFLMTINTGDLTRAIHLRIKDTLYMYQKFEKINPYIESTYIAKTCLESLSQNLKYLKL